LHFKLTSASFGTESATYEIKRAFSKTDKEREKLTEASNLPEPDINDKFAFVGILSGIYQNYHPHRSLTNLSHFDQVTFIFKRCSNCQLARALSLLPLMAD